MRSAQPLPHRWISALMLGLILLASPPALLAQQAASPKADTKADAKAAEAPAEVVRAEMGVIFQKVQDLLKAGNAPGALTALAEADQLPNRTAFEILSINRVRGSVALVARDFALARRSLEATVSDARLGAADRRAAFQGLVVATQRLGDHAAAVRYAREFFAAGGQGDAMKGAMVRSMFSTKNWAGVVQEAPALVKEIEAAGRKPDEELLKIWATALTETKNEAGYFAAIEALVRHHPSPDYWGDLLSRLQNRPGFADRLVLDALRLMRRTESMVDEAEYMGLAQLAVQAALPGEAVAVLEEGFKAEVLGKGTQAAAHRDLRARATKAAAEDRGQLAQSEASAEKSGDAWRLFAVGEAAISYGQADKGLALMEKAIGQGLKRNAEDGKLRYGVALLLAGRRDQARAQLQSVQGQDGVAELARLWLLAVR